MTSQNKIQYTDLPQVNSLNRLQYEEIFDVNPPMQEAIDEELNIYLSQILNSLYEENLSSTTDITHTKKCPSCNQKQIANRKQVCPRNAAEF